MDLKQALNLGGWSHRLTKKDSDSESDSDSSSDSSSDSEAIDVNQEVGELKLPKLPFKSKDLQDILSSDTLDEHMKLHKQYVDHTREMVVGTKLEKMELDDVVKLTARKPESKLFLNAAQAWNHAFYWRSISPPNQDTAPKGDLGNIVNQTFGSIDACREKLIKSASEVFGSGWVWLVQKDGKLSIMTTQGAGTPVQTKGVIPLLCIDLWEHAYYLDYKSDRMSYMDSAVKQLLNWGFADDNWEAKEDW